MLVADYPLASLNQATRQETGLNSERKVLLMAGFALAVAKVIAASVLRVGTCVSKG